MDDDMKKILVSTIIYNNQKFGNTRGISFAELSSKCRSIRTFVHFPIEMLYTNYRRCMYLVFHYLFHFWSTGRFTHMFYSKIMPTDAMAIRFVNSMSNVFRDSNDMYFVRDNSYVLPRYR